MAYLGAAVNQQLLSARTQALSPSRSSIAARMFDDLMFLDPPTRRMFMADLTKADWTQLLTVANHEGGTPYCIWQDDPIGFIEDVLGENTWSKQQEIMAALTRTKKVAVPSAVGMGKTYVAARATLWRSMVYPVGTSLTVTLAPRRRQVERLLWPHIRAVAVKAQLPVTVQTTTMKAMSAAGVETVVAYGFSAPPNAESAVQGIHSPKLFVVVDEAGGLARPVGSALRGILTGDETRMLAIGNPATDDEGSWFETLCKKDKDVTVIDLPAWSSPAITGEKTGPCTSCPPEAGEHLIAAHVTDQSFIDGTIADYGRDAPYVIAKIDAKFPTGGAARILPPTWLDLAAEKDEPEVGRRLCDLGLDDEDAPHKVTDGAWVRLGIDVAAAGGDEFAIARIVGDLATIEHHSAGAVNANPTDVAGMALRHIKRAERLAERLGTTVPVRVKIDGLGVGWGVVGILQAWGTEGLHNAEIVPVLVSESTGRDDPKADMRPWRKRDEMWLATRSLLRPPRDNEAGMIRMRVDDTTIAQLGAPTYGTNASGYTVIESKDSLKGRGLRSPDRGEAILLGLYEPLEPEPKGTEFRIIGG